MSETQPSPVALRIAAGLVSVLLVGVVVLSQVLGSDESTDSADDPTTPPTAQPTAPPRTGPVALVPVDAPQADSAECVGLTSALPDGLPNADNPLRRLPIAEPAPPATAAWGTDRGEPLVLRCGLARPPELSPTAQLTVIDEVQWLRVGGGGDARTWYVVDRPVYLAVTVPGDTGIGPMQELSAAVADKLAPTPVRTR